MKTISTPDAPAALGPYSQAKVLGQPAVHLRPDPPGARDHGDVTGAIEAQTEQVLQNLGAVLAAAGTDWSRVLKTTVFLTDLADFAAFNAVYERVLGAAKPARSTVQVAALPKGAKVEIDRWWPSSNLSAAGPGTPGTGPGSAAGRPGRPRPGVPCAAREAANRLAATSSSGSTGARRRRAWSRAACSRARSTGTPRHQSSAATLTARSQRVLALDVHGQEHPFPPGQDPHQGGGQRLRGPCSMKTRTPLSQARQAAAGKSSGTMACPVRASAIRSSLRLVGAAEMVGIEFDARHRAGGAVVVAVPGRAGSAMTGVWSAMPAVRKAVRPGQPARTRRQASASPASRQWTGERPC